MKISNSNNDDKASLEWDYCSMILGVLQALFAKTEDKAEDNAGSDESSLCWRRRGPAKLRSRGANNEAEDTAGSAEAPRRQQRGRGHRRLRRGPTQIGRASCRERV